MQKILATTILFSLIILSGCIQQQENGAVCAQVITPAVSPQGECIEFPTPCDVPAGFTIVNNCEEQREQEQPQDGTQDTGQILCFGIICADLCDGTTRLSEGRCVEGQCSYASTTPNSPQCGFDDSEYRFESELVFCEYDGIVDKYTLFYQIRNRTENIPTYRSKIWIKVPELDYGQAKTIQANYEQDRILWEEQQYSYEGVGYKGQAWEIRNVDTNADLHFQLIYCEPDVSDKEDCDETTGIVIVEGDTGDLCTVAGQI